MKLRRSLSLALVIAAYSLLALNVSAQSPPTPSPVKLSLKLITYEGAGPTFYPVADEDGSGMGVEIRHFRRQSHLAASDAARISLATLTFVRLAANVHVSVYVNSANGASRECRKIAEYLVGEGREYAVRQLSRFGIEPLRLGVVRRAEVKILPPRIDNRTSAVVVTGIEIHERVPSIELTMKNVSAKPIRAVEIRELRGYRVKGAPPRFDWRGMALIKPDAVWKVTLEFGWNDKVTEEGHSVEPPDRVIINSVLFSDGTYEGDMMFAAKAEAYKTGRRNQLARVLDILRERGAALGIDAREAARALGAQVALLECTVEWSAVVDLAGRYPSLPNSELDEIKTSMEAGMARQRSMLMNDLAGAAISLASETEEEKLTQWVKLKSEMYEKQLAEI